MNKSGPDIVDRRGRGKLGTEFNVVQQGSEAKSSGPMFQIQKESADENGPITQQGTQGGTSFNLTQTGAEGKPLSALQGAATGEEYSARQSGPESQGMNGVGGESSSPGTNVDLVAPASQGNSDGGVTGGTNGGTGGMTVAGVVAGRAAAPVGSHQSILEKSLQEALIKVCDPGEGGTIAMGSVSGFGVLPIDSPELHGYLVVGASAIEPAQQLAFLRDLRTTLTEMFKSNGIQAAIEDGFVISVEEIRFSEWIESEGAVTFFTLGNSSC